jgi:hypothetical protein
MRGRVLIRQTEYDAPTSHEHCRVCAESCRRCAEACEEFLQAAK